jgi:hypothetical protein
MRISHNRAVVRGLQAAAFAVAFGLATPGEGAAQGGASPARPFGTLREQAVLQQQWLARRMRTILPALMQKHGVDMWVIPMREYVEDPLFTSIVSPTTFAARRRTIYVFFDPFTRLPRAGCDAAFGRIALGGTAQGGVYQAMRSTRPAAGPAGGRAERRAELWGDEQWEMLRQVVEQHDPRVIAINTSRDWAFADGLTAAELEGMRRALGPKWAARFRPAAAEAGDEETNRQCGVGPRVQAV